MNLSYSCLIRMSKGVVNSLLIVMWLTLWLRIIVLHTPIQVLCIVVWWIGCSLSLSYTLCSVRLSPRLYVSTNIRLLLVLTRILFHKLSTLVGVHMGITIFGGVGVMMYLRFTWNWFCGDELSLHARFVQNPADNVYIIPSRIFVQNPAGNCPRRSGSNM